jgi:Cu-Zn family superoxide dismutase
MKTGVIILALAATLAASAVHAAHHAIGAEIIGTDGKVIGKATMRQGPTGVLIYVEVNGLSPGAHAIHIHSVGTCHPNFKASKGHVNVAGKKHGLLNPEGPDNGDLPNIFVSADGTAKAEMFTTRVSIEGGDEALLDADGSALVIHENRDDHSAQPIGGAGGRVACGVIKAM